MGRFRKPEAASQKSSLTEILKTIYSYTIKIGVNMNKNEHNIFFPSL